MYPWKKRCKICATCHLVNFGEYTTARVVPENPGYVHKNGKHSKDGSMEGDISGRHYIISSFPDQDFSFFLWLKLD